MRRAVRDGLVDAVWVRDLPVVPLGDPDAGQFDDPFAYLARVAPTGMPGVTFGTASAILGVRHPLVLARAAAAAQVAYAGRFVLGMGSGGKPAMNDALGVADRSAELFAQRWRALRAALDGQVGDDVVLGVAGAMAPGPVYLASARASHWAAIDGAADGWMAFLDRPTALQRTLDEIASTRGGDVPPVALRLDLTLADAPLQLEERGRLRCRPADLMALLRDLLSLPVEHLMVRLAGDDSGPDLRTLREVWDRVA